MGLEASNKALQRMVAAIRGSLTGVALFSLVINLLMLTTPLYMLQIYDRVLTSQSIDTLIALTVLAVSLIALAAILELARARIMVRVGARVDTHLNEAVFSALAERQLKGRDAGAEPLRDLETVRGFLAGNGLLAIFDSPWTPIFIALIFVFHPILGAIALCGAILLFSLAVVSEFVSRAPQRGSAAAAFQAHEMAGATLRNAEAARAMGMLPQLRRRWLDQHMSGLAYHGVASDRAGILTAAAKFIRPGLQIAMLGSGAYLVLQESITAGVMIASSIIMGRALAPVEAAINQWRSFISARAAYGRLKSLLQSFPPHPETLALPAPEGQVSVENAVVLPPRGGKPILRGVAFAIAPGEIVGVIGPSGAGKSSLARLLVGVWPPAAGHVRLDGADLDNWLPEDLGPHIGYLPQDVELFSGTVAENIARFETPNSDKIIEAAKLCDAHDMILRLSDGYDTEIGEGGCVLSGGQRQRLALARALYGSPRLIVLDEPNANLDSEGESALQNTLLRLKANRQTIVIVSHRPNILVSMDKLLLLRAGKVDKFGPPGEVMPRLMGSVQKVPSVANIKVAKKHG